MNDLRGFVDLGTVDKESCDRFRESPVYSLSSNEIESGVCGPITAEYIQQLQRNLVLSFDLKDNIALAEFFSSSKDKWCGCEFEHKYQRQIHNLSHMAVGSICKIPKRNS